MEQRFLKGNLKARWLEERRQERDGKTPNQLRQEELLSQESRPSQQGEPGMGLKDQGGQKIRGQKANTQGSTHQQRYDSLVDRLKTEYGLSDEAAKVWADMA
jgi:hypothetical protein